MIFAPITYLTDPLGGVWQLGVTNVTLDIGSAYTVSPAPGGQPGIPNVVLLDLANNNPFSMVVLLNPENQPYLEITPTSGPGQENVPCITPDGATLMGICVINGYISVIKLPIYCQTGILYEANRKYLPTFTQPGGPGSTAYPIQASGELLGQWTAGCSHSFNHWYISSQACSGIQCAFVMCPVCMYLQQIIAPFSAIYSWPYEIIMG